MSINPNKIKYTTTPTTGCIKVGNFVLGINGTVAYGPTSITDFWQGYSHPNCGYVIYLPKAVQGPSIYAPNNDSELIWFANRLGGVGITTVPDALNWFYSQNGDFVVVNREYVDIKTVDLLMLLDAGFTPSYPQTGTTWADLSFSGNVANLFNNVSYSSDGYGSLTFNSSDSQYVTLPTNFFNPNNGDPFTVTCWFKTSSTGVIFGQQNSPVPDVASGYVPAIYVDNNGYLRTSCFWGGSVSNQSVTSSSVNDGQWHEVTIVYDGTNQISYLDGFQFDSILKSQINYSSTYYYFLGTGASVGWANANQPPYFNGQIGIFCFYNTNLSPSEVYSNYNEFYNRINIPNCINNSNFLLQEDLFYLLQEDGGKIIIT